MVVPRLLSQILCYQVDLQVTVAQDLTKFVVPGTVMVVLLS